MTDQDSTRTQLSDLRARTWPLVLILVATTVGWFLLAYLSLHARGQEAKGLTVADYTQAKDWAKELLGLAGTFAGFLGIAAAAHSLGLTEDQRAQSAEGGMIGILAGATLLGVGGWPVPAALAAMLTAVSTVRVVKALRKS
jgi:hypothetical protein